MQQMYNSVSCAALRNNDYFQEVSWVCAFLSTFAILVPLNPASVILAFAQLVSLLGFLRSYIMSASMASLQWRVNNSPCSIKSSSKRVSLTMTLSIFFLHLVSKYSWYATMWFLDRWTWSTSYIVKLTSFVPTCYRLWQVFLDDVKRPGHLILAKEQSSRPSLDQLDVRIFPHIGVISV